MSNDTDVLVIDGDRASLASTSAQVAEAGIQVYASTSSGVAGLSLLARRPATVVVLPFDLPDLSNEMFGRGVAQILRRQAPLVVGVRSRDPRTAGAALDAGAHAVFLRDGDPEIMLRAVAEAS